MSVELISATLIGLVFGLAITVIASFYKHIFKFIRR